MAHKKQASVCPVETAGITYVDYKDTAFLKQFLSKFNRIVPRQYSGTTLKNQKKIATAIKRARYMALLPYVVDPRHNTFSLRGEVATTPTETTAAIDAEATGV